jgi:DedD protein
MAFFKFRKGSDDVAPPPFVPESIEAMRKRAKQRLIGAFVLVLIGVIGFPLLVDNQPRPIAVDIPISIPDRNKVAPLPAPPGVAPSATPSAPATPATPSPSSTASASSGTVVQETKGPIVQASPPTSAPSSPAPSSAPAPVAAPSVAAPSVVKDQAKPATVPQEPKKAELDSGARAQALLEGSPLVPGPSPAPNQAGLSSPAAPVAAPGERYIVQFGAYADAAKARESRLKVEAAGLKTYSQMVETPEGKRYRVRVGPYVTRVEAEKAAEKIKKLDFQAAILTIPS